MATIVSGPIIDALNSTGFKVTKIWGHEGSFKSFKRAKRWEEAMSLTARTDSENCRKIITRCLLRDKDLDWLPFPQAAPRWVIEKDLGSPNDLVEFLANSRAACSKASAILRKFPISREITMAAEITLGGWDPYVDFYFLIPLDVVDEFRCASTWQNQNRLFQLVTEEHPSALSEYSPDWLSPLRLDIYIPEIRVAIEYNGQQHYRPIEYFGGLSSFEAGQRRDQLKAELCEKFGVKLIIWPYWQVVSRDELRRVLDAGV